MIRRNRTNDRLVALFLLGAFLFLPPLLLVFNRPVMVAGIPVLYLYLFAAWAGLIGLVALTVRRIDAEGDPSSAAAPATDSAKDGADA